MKLFPIHYLFAALLVSLSARAASSDPVGVLRLKLRGNSDTIVSLPLHRPALVEASPTARNGNTLTFDAEIPSLPAGGAYALVMTGSLEGAALPIVSVAANTVTLEATSFDLSQLEVDRDTVAIIPFWTLDTLFTNGRGVNVTTGSPFATEVLLFNNHSTGINHSAAKVFFYLAATAKKPAGWYRLGDTAVAQGSQRLEPGSYFIVRHNVPVDTELTLTGCVQMGAQRLLISTLAPHTTQDNLIGLSVATPITLGSSNLITSGAFAATTSSAPQSDQLFVFDNLSVGKNKSASAVYFYLGSGTAKPAGWYRVGDTAVSADAVVLKPGEGLVIRKRGSATPRSDAWDLLPAYLQ